MAKTTVTGVRLGAQCLRRNVSEAFPKNGFFSKRQVCVSSACWSQQSLPRGILEEAIVLNGATAVGTVSVSGLWSENRADGFCASLGVSGQCRWSASTPPLSRGLWPLTQGLWQGARGLHKWPAREGFPHGVGFSLMWFLFPFQLYSGWDWFLSGGSQLPRCCHLFLCFRREVFFFHLQNVFLFFLFFFATKRKHQNSVSPLDCDLPVLTVKSLVL